MNSQGFIIGVMDILRNRKEKKNNKCIIVHFLPLPFFLPLLPFFFFLALRP
jgi:hypothetical protein